MVSTVPPSYPQPIAQQQQRWVADIGFRDHRTQSTQPGPDHFTRLGWQRLDGGHGTDTNARVWVLLDQPRT